MTSLPSAGSTDAPPSCRLCDGPTHAVMTKTLLNRHVVGYWRCGDCGSIQTDAPWWLDDAYAIDDVGTDVGICQRTLQLVLETTALMSVIAYPPEQRFLDFGGANGLFTRMMRDRGLNFYCYDRYQKPFYAPQFAAGSLGEFQPNVITAFEVFEHFVNPKENIAELTDTRADLVVFTTEVCDGQPEDWYYFAPDSGQHIFFYTSAALHMTAEKSGYAYFDLGLLKVLARHDFVEARRAAGTDLPGLFTKVARNRAGFINHGIKLLTAHFAAPHRHIFADLEIAVAQARRQK